MASQPHGPDVNGPVYWRAKLDEGNNPQSAPQLSVTQVLHFLNWKSFPSDIFKGMERNCELVPSVILNA
jgi:hypothetical protein